MLHAGYLARTAEVPQLPDEIAALPNIPAVGKQETHAAQQILYASNRDCRSPASFE